MIKPRPIYCPNVILLHSENNNVFPIKEAESIVKKVTLNREVITIYIHHEIDDLKQTQIIVENYDYSIFKETRENSGNIASNYLKSGSDYVYYIKADEENYRAAFIHIYDILSSDYPIICIANYLVGQVKAGAIVLENKKEDLIEDIKDLVYLPDTLFSTRQFLEKQITFNDRKLILK